MQIIKLHVPLSGNSFEQSVHLSVGSDHLGWTSWFAIPAAMHVEKVKNLVAIGNKTIIRAVTSNDTERFASMPVSGDAGFIVPCEVIA